MRHCDSQAPSNTGQPSRLVVIIAIRKAAEVAVCASGFFPTRRARHEKVLDSASGSTYRVRTPLYTSVQYGVHAVMLPAADRSRGCGGSSLKVSGALTCLPAACCSNLFTYAPSRRDAVPRGDPKALSVSVTAQPNAIEQWPAVTLVRKLTS